MGDGFAVGELEMGSSCCDECSVDAIVEGKANCVPGQRDARDSVSVFPCVDKVFCSGPRSFGHK